MNYYKNNFHLEAPNGLINDPNGISYFQGTYYVFHQWNRFACDHSYKEWGLFLSENLVDWSHSGSAILPDSPQDSHGVYSGSAIVFNNELRIFYTGNTKLNSTRKSYQQSVVSKDGQTFLKTNSFETPEGLTEHHRDPKVFLYGNDWYMIVGSQTQDYIGAIALYSSSDLENWKYQGICFKDSELDQMCECPDLLDFGDKQVLLVCPQKRNIEIDQDCSSYSGYYVGQFNGQKFLPSTKLFLLDHGFDFYAPQTFRDPEGRYLMWAWMSRMTDEEEQACPTLAFDYLHCLTMPREIILDKEGRLLQKPIKEILDRRKQLKIDSSKQLDFIQTGDSLVLDVYFESEASDFKLNLAEGIAIFSYKNKQLCLQRKSWIDGKMHKKHLLIEKLEYFQLFLDQSAIEMFINDGDKVISLRYFPEKELKKHQFTCDTSHQAFLYKLEIGEQNG
ncbi:glycoside hydrolase family 32 protein [Streptococcus merionis]|uniref:glycoside hydrolase family 32 protein n=1 Tax=Streptococcus merionis TaxID=400065 RepID=UPI003515A2E9